MNNNILKQKDFRGYKQAIIPGIDKVLAYTDSKTYVENTLDAIGILLL